MQFEEVASQGRAMTIYWAFCEHVPADKLNKYKSKPMDERTGMFWHSGLTEHLDEACVEWKQLLKEIISINVEPKRTDVEKAMARWDSAHNGLLFHADNEHELGKRWQSQGIKNMISHVALKNETNLF